MSYGAGDYFGEMALLNKKQGVRLATIKATSEVLPAGIGTSRLPALLN